MKVGAGTPPDFPELRQRFIFRHYDDPKLYLEQYLRENSYTGTYAAGKWGPLATGRKSLSTLACRQTGLRPSDEKYLLGLNKDSRQRLIGACASKYDVKFEPGPWAPRQPPAAPGTNRTNGLDGNFWSDRTNAARGLNEPHTHSSLYMPEVQHERAQNTVQAGQYFAELALKIRQALIDKELAQCRRKNFGRLSVQRSMSGNNQSTSLPPCTGERRVVSANSTSPCSSSQFRQFPSSKTQFQCLREVVDIPMASSTQTHTLQRHQF